MEFLILSALEILWEEKIIMKNISCCKRSNGRQGGDAITTLCRPHAVFSVNNSTLALGNVHGNPAKIIMMVTGVLMHS